MTPIDRACLILEERFFKRSNPWCELRGYAAVDADVEEEEERLTLTKRGGVN